MKSDLISYFRNPIQLMTWALLIKLMIMGLNLSDCLGAFVILAAQLVTPIVQNKYPKQPDLFKEITELELRLLTSEAKIDAVESDVTGLKFGMTSKR